MWLWHTHGSLNLGQKTRPYNNQKKKTKRICKILDFAVLADHRLNRKNVKRRISTSTLLGNWKKNKQWNMKMTIIPILIGVFDTVTNGLLEGLEDLNIGGRVETMEMTALLRTAIILRRFMETWGTCCHSNSCEDHHPKLMWLTIIMRIIIMGNPLEIVQEVKVWPNYQMYSKIRIFPRKSAYKFPAKKPHLVLIYNKKEKFYLVDFVVLTNNWEQMGKIIKKILRSYQRVEKTVGFKGDSYVNCHWWIRQRPQNIGTKRNFRHDEG